MNIIEVENIADERVKDYSRLTEAQLRSRLRPEDARIIVESPKVIRVALESGLTPLSLLCERRHIDGDARDVIAMAGDDIDIFTAERDTLASLTGYTLTRGVLSAMRRPAPRDAAEIIRDARRVCVLDGVCDSTNIGAIFRSAAALGIDAVLLAGGCCDPYCRRAIRVSMGSVFLVPWAEIESFDVLKECGFKTLAMALRHDSIPLQSDTLRAEPKLAIVMGTEGDGLADGVIVGADYVVRIPMSHCVDSLNVAAASAVAFWELACRPTQ